MTPDDAKINARLKEVLESIFCPVGGCWCLHGCPFHGDESYLCVIAAGRMTILAAAFL